ncbi:hypothetical protein [Flindersiella endophytica]
MIVQHSNEKPGFGSLDGAAAGGELRSARATVVRENKQSATMFRTWLTGTTRVVVPGQLGAPPHRHTMRSATA